MRIDKDILFGLLASKLEDEAALWLTRTLVYHDCTGDYVLRGDPGLMHAIPAHKTLFGTETDKGLSIGNLNIAIPNACSKFGQIENSRHPPLTPSVISCGD